MSPLLPDLLPLHTGQGPPIKTYLFQVPGFCSDSDPSEVLSSLLTHLCLTHNPALPACQCAQQALNVCRQISWFPSLPHLGPDPTPEGPSSRAVWLALAFEASGITPATFPGNLREFALAVPSAPHPLPQSAFLGSAPTSGHREVPSDHPALNRYPLPPLHATPSLNLQVSLSTTENPVHSLFACMSFTPSRCQSQCSLGQETSASFPSLPPVPGMRPGAQVRSGGGEWNSSSLPATHFLLQPNRTTRASLSPPVAVGAQSLLQLCLQPGLPFPSVHQNQAVLCLTSSGCCFKSQHQQNPSRWAFQTPVAAGGGREMKLWDRECVVRTCTHVCVWRALATYTLPWT